MGGIYFTAADPKLNDVGRTDYLYYSDGTAAGTRSLGIGGVYRIQEFRGEAVALQTENGIATLRRLSADGRTSSILYSDNSGSLPTLIGEAGGRLYFSTGSGSGVAGGLWSTDGTQAGTRLLTTDGNAGIPYVFEQGGRTFVSLQFSAGDSNRAVYRLDPNDVLTKILDFNSGPFGYAAYSIAPVAGGFVYAASTRDTGAELWFSNGTPGDAHLLADIAPGSASAMNGSEFIKINGRVLFAANGPQGLSLYSTDGTSSGTQLVTDRNGQILAGATLNANLNTPGYSEYPNEANIVDGRALIRTNNGYYLTDGTSANTTRIQASIDGKPIDIARSGGAGGAPVSYSPGVILAYGDYVLSQDQSGTKIHAALFKIDLASGAAVEIADPNTTYIPTGRPGSNVTIDEDNVADITHLGGGLFAFAAASSIGTFSGATSNSELYFSRGYPGSTSSVDLVPGAVGSTPNLLTPVGSIEPFVAPRRPSYSDFNGDGRSDILWRNDNGTLTDWLSTGLGLVGNSAATNAVSTAWHVSGIADFNGDGRSDILWRNNDGTLTDWLSSGQGFVGNNAATNSVTTDWRVAGTGDFNGDGRADILWRNDNGTVTDWLSSGEGFAGNNAATNAVSTSWRVAGTGDFNGDGRDDILWRNDNGTVTNWLSSGQGFVGNNAATNAVSTDWKVAGTGDFDGDGRDDILWRNDNGTLTDWLSSGQGFVGNSAATNNVSTDWQVAGTGDFNGDGRDDILWRNSNGYMTEWLSTGRGFAGNSLATNLVEPSWHIQSNEFLP